ncbi:PEP-CTERM sorting domain-containing protein [Roseateles sp. BYS78W]|uniref:PEP-CTERM sorting domain-containing protein n=1 Tax=Pelomonas candidula TaxID=3299025 RepID=A0ABW7H7T6_9BURK
MLKLKTGAALAAALLLAGTAGAATTDGVANGGFESVDAGSHLPTGWVVGDSSPATLSSDAHSGAYSVLLSAPGGFGGSSLLQNSVANGGLPALTAANLGDTPLLSFWTKGDASTTGNAKFALSYMGAGGAVLYDSGLQFFQNNINSSGWTQISFQGAAIPAGTQAVYLLFNTAVGPLLDGRPNAVYIDDVQLTLHTAAVPEPSSYALLLAGLGAVGAIVRRRA